ncbi:hypothetical protein ABPG74_011384 [Tetrahymena malaccensis]
MNFLVLILLQVKLLAGTWLISQKNLAPGFVGTDGWSILGSSCEPQNTSICNNTRILGGYGCFGTGATATQTFLIAHHWQVNVKIRFWMIDSWDTESLVVDLGDLHISQVRQYSSGYQICGDPYWNDEVRDVSVTKQNHYERNIQVRFGTNLDQDAWDESWGITDFTISVEPCNPTCNRCQGQDAFLCMDCWPNAQFIVYKNSLGFCQCNDGFYTVSKNVPCLDPICSQCLPCNSTCETCSAGDQYSCISCKPNLYKQYYGAYEVNNNLSDPSGQLEYDCTSCINGLYLDGTTTGQCVSTCSTSYYKDDSDKKCKKCDSSCLQCLDNKPQFCSKCINGSFLTINTGKCVTDCGIGQWGRNSDWSCQLCDSTCYACVQNAQNCTSCTGIYYFYNNQCITTCPDGFYKGSNNTCKKCDQSCKTCDNGSNQDCLSCSPSFGYLKDRQCISCPPQFYGDSNDQTCKPCNNSCFTCDGGNNTDCLSCTTNYLQDRQCKVQCNSGYWGNSTTHTCDKCNKNCLTCSLYGPDIDCQSCSSPLYLKDKICVQSCNPIGEYGDDNTRKCTVCDSTCYTCSQKTDSDCNSCTGSRQFYNNKCLPQCPAPLQYGLNNKCTSSCPSNMYGDDSTRLCTLCNSICPTCFGSQTSQCYSCAEPYYLEDCLECNGGTNTNCTKCDPAKYFGSNQCFISCPAPYFSSTITMECVLKCPKGYWGDPNDPQRICQLCHPQCEECFGGTFGQCTKCKPNFYLFQTTCDSCPINYFPNAQGRTCDQCFTTCKSCDGPSSSNCLSCNSDRYYLASKKECYDICPMPYFSHFTKPDCLLTCPTDFKNYLFGNPQSRKCENCNEACIQCTGPSNLDCVKCSTNYFYYQQNNSCLLMCPDGTYADSPSMKCLPCDKSCSTCNGGTNLNCISCSLPSVLYNNQCIQNCPNPLYKDEDLKQCVMDCSAKYPNKYADTTSSICKYCHKYCNKCTGPSNTQCQKCKSSYFKYNNSCIEQCQQGTYLETKKSSENEDDCKKCSTDCQTCYGPSSQNCLTCNLSLYSLKKIDLLLCLSDCPDQYVKDVQNKSCQTCPSSTYFFQGQCKQCHYTCNYCSGPFENQCLTCAETRGQNSQKTPYKGVCSCQQGYIETFQKECSITPAQVQGLIVSTYVSSISGTVGSFLIGIIGRNMFFIYNILEIAQFTSYFRYINFNYPANLGNIFDQLYISQISTAFDLYSQPPTNQEQSNQNQQNGNSRILENTSFDDYSFLFELKGKKKSDITTMSQVQIKKQTRLEALNKSQKLDLFEYQIKINPKKESSRILDNSSTVQMQKDYNQDDFDLSKVNQNDSVYQYDPDNPFQFLEIQQSPTKQLRKHKKTKKFTENQVNQNSKVQNEQNENNKNKFKANDNHLQQISVKQSKDQQADIIDVTNQQVKMNQIEIQQNSLNNKIKEFTDDFSIINSASPKQKNQKQNQDINSQTDFNKIPYSETPATYLKAESPYPSPFSSKVSKEENKFLIAPTPECFSISKDSSPQLSNLQLADLETNKEVKDEKQSNQKLKVNPNIQKNSQLLIKFNKVEQEQDFNQQELEIHDKSQQKQSNLNIISFLTEITESKLKNKQPNKKQVLKF